MNSLPESIAIVADETWLRSRFQDSHRAIAVITGDGHAFHPPGKLRAASVLVPVIDRAGGFTILFTRRTSHLHDHAGQISFPGGRAEPGDSTSAHTALRETEEEIGLSPSRVEILGALHEYVTVTGYRVTPVVGLVRPPFSLTPDEFEVAEIFEVPLAFFLDPSNHQRNSVYYEGRQRIYYAMPYREYYIWGATAGMMMNFFSFLTG